jgi:hypothetical protein
MPRKKKTDLATAPQFDVKVTTARCGTASRSPSPACGKERRPTTPLWQFPLPADAAIVIVAGVLLVVASPGDPRR